MRLAPAALAFLIFALPAVAETGDAAAVIQYCGAPVSEHQGVSPVTNQMQRDLNYGSVILHFVPSPNGWTFLSGWHDHLPLTRSMVESRMPCVQEALSFAASQQPPDPSVNVDPSIRAQTEAQEVDRSTFGVPHLRLILILAALVFLSYVFLPGKRRSASRRIAVESMRQRRRPFLDRVLGRKPDEGTDA